jgi:hypothetical protein
MMRAAWSRAAASVEKQIDGTNAVARARTSAFIHAETDA